MALRINDRISGDTENATKACKSFLKKPSQSLAGRQALGTLCGNNIRLKQHGLKKPLSVSSHLRQPLASLKPNKSVVPKKDEQQELEDMEVTSMAVAFSEPLSIEDIDQNDYENPLLCAEYVKDIYKYLRSLELKFRVTPGYLTNQPEITAGMRRTVIDWLIQVHLKFNLFPETLYLTVSTIDRYLEISKVMKYDLQLVGVTAMFIASKYEEIYPPEVKDFTYITDDTYTSEEIRNKEREMMNKLGYMFGNPLPLHFLRRNSKAAEVTPEMHTMAKFLLELCLADYAMINFLPSQQAASALWLTMRLHGIESWDAKVSYYSGYSEVDLRPCVRRMAELTTKMGVAKQQAVRSKYSGSKFSRVAKDSKLKSQLLTDLAYDM